MYAKFFIQKIITQKLRFKKFTVQFLSYFSVSMKFWGIKFPLSKLK